MIIPAQVRRALLVGLIFSAFTSTAALAQSKTLLPKAKPTYAELLVTAAAADWPVPGKRIRAPA